MVKENGTPEPHTSKSLGRLQEVIQNPLRRGPVEKYTPFIRRGDGLTLTLFLAAPWRCPEAQMQW